MATTYKITNTRIEKDILIVFIEFSNGEINSNKFPVSSTIVDILNWAEKNAKIIDDRQVELEILQNQIKEEMIDIPMTEQRISELKEQLLIEENKLKLWQS